MKTAAILAALFASASAFAPVANKASSTTQLNAGFASEAVQLATFAGFVGTVVVMPRSGTGVVSAPAAAAPAAAAAAVSGDVSVPYDAAAMLAYEQAGKPGDFEAYKAKYLKETVDMIKSKQK
ncbi:MAG: hypothetical protein SGILL_008782 [Bacillariaceae sp.]